jgi:protein TonB
MAESLDHRVEQGPPSERIEPWPEIPPPGQPVPRPWPEIPEPWEPEPEPPPEPEPAPPLPTEPWPPEPEIEPLHPSRQSG